MKTKRILSCLLAAACAMSVAGCGGNQEKAKNGEVPTLIYLVPGDPQSDEASVEAELNKILETKIGAKIDLQFIDWSAWQEKTNLMLASNEYFDITSAYAMSVPELVDNGSVYPLTELLDEHAPVLKAELEDYFWEAAKVDGEIYCIPNQQIEANNIGVCVRKDLAEKYNVDFDAVDTLMDLEPFWQQIRDNEPDLYPFDMRSSQEFIADALERDPSIEALPVSAASGYGTTLLKIYYDDLKVVATPDFRNHIDGARLAYECGEKGYFRKDRATAADDSADYATGRYASFTNWYKPGVEAELKNKTGYDYLCKMLGTAHVTESTPLSTKTVINANTKYPEESIKFLELLNTDKEVYNLVCFGIEGKHYTWADEEHIECNSESGYFTNSSWVFGNVFNAYPQVGQEVDVWEKTKELNDSAVKSPLMGLAFDTSEITLELAQCNKVQQTYLVSRIDRAVDDPDSYWEEYRAELKKAGIDKVIECYQSQVDEFMANKN